MKITPGTEALQAQKPMDPAHFTGRAMARDLIQAAQQATSIFAAVVRFEAGARNHWHSHSGGQLLHVIEGEGWVQVRGQEPERIRLHDTVAEDAAEESGHAGGGDALMWH